MLLFFYIFFFFKQKTAYEMRISDWSSDVCSSDLSGKPADIIAKMVDGAVKKFAKENALLSQLFVIDNKTPIADVVAKAGKAAGTTITLKDFVRFQLGEGRSEEHTSELQSLMRISYAVFCLKKKKQYIKSTII